MDQQLNRECSLFTEDGRYVIVGSAALIPDDLRPHFYHIHSNNEAVTPTIRYTMWYLVLDIFPRTVISYFLLMLMFILNIQDIIFHSNPFSIEQFLLDLSHVFTFCVSYFKFYYKCLNKSLKH